MTSATNPLWTAAVLASSGVAWRRSTQIRQLRRENQRLREQTIDSVVGLPIRAVWEAEASAVLDVAPERAVLILADLDDFKSINDNYGHPAGDLVLGDVAARLQRIFTGALISRIGGDEFAVLAQGMFLPESVDEFIRLMNQPICVPPAQSVYVTASLGIARCRNLPAPVTLTAALREADRDLYTAKRRTRRHEHRLLRAPLRTDAAEHRP